MTRFLRIPFERRKSTQITLFRNIAFGPHLYATTASPRGVCPFQAWCATSITCKRRRPIGLIICRLVHSQNSNGSRRPAARGAAPALRPSGDGVAASPPYPFPLLKSEMSDKRYTPVAKYFADAADAQKFICLHAPVIARPGIGPR